MTKIEELNEKIEKLDLDIKILLIAHRALMDVYTTDGTHEAKERASHVVDEVAEFRRRKAALKAELAALESDQPPPEPN